MGGVKQTQFTDGINARMRGDKLEDNPYLWDYNKGMDWIRGWYEADKTTDDCENGRGDE